jgi:predicted nucleic acid-binding protein
MFSKILVPKEVIEEIFGKDSPENIVIKRELGNFIIEIKVENINDLNIHRGEKAAISACLEKNLPFLSDDKKARKLAALLEIECTGVIGILIWNLEKNKINKQECKRLLKKLIESGYYMTTRIYDEIISIIEKGE